MANQYDFTEEERKEVVRHYLANGQSQVKTANLFNISKSSIERWIKKYRHQIEYNIKDDQKLRGVSRLESWRDEAGNYQAQWIKTDVEKEEAREVLRSVAEGLINTIQPVEKREFKGACQSALCSSYIISDFHLGQYSSLKEIGESWTLNEAFNIICSWIDAAVIAAPKSEQAILCDLGDFLHTDGLLPITPSSGHILDADGRFFDCVDVAIHAFDYMINKLLDHHEKVHVLICEGNHDLASAHWLTRLIARKYENEPRLSFDKSDLPYYSVEWGKTGLFFHHGHKRRIGQLSETFVASFREMYGRTKYHYAHVGHLHHRELKESGLMVIEQHSTLAAKDAHSGRGGYYSERGASVVTYHKDFGEVARATIRPEMLI